ncbi:hypothetical protein GCM10027073_26210 [Streptomyces chlorus]
MRVETFHAGDLVAHAGGVDGEADVAFWDAVKREDSAVVAEELGPDAEALHTVLPALSSSWRRRERQRRKVQRWRYRVDWKPLPNSRAQESLQGGWLLVVPQGRCPCRKPHPAWLRSMLVLVKEAAESVGSMYVEAGDFVRIGDR